MTFLELLTILYEEVDHKYPDPHGKVELSPFRPEMNDQDQAYLHLMREILDNSRNTSSDYDLSVLFVGAVVIMPLYDLIRNRTYLFNKEVGKQYSVLGPKCGKIYGVPIITDYGLQKRFIHPTSVLLANIDHKRIPEEYHELLEYKPRPQWIV